MTNFTAQEMINRIARSLELTRKQFAKPTSKATASKVTRGAAAKQKIKRGRRSKGLEPLVIGLTQQTFCCAHTRYLRHPEALTRPLLAG